VLTGFTACAAVGCGSTPPRDQNYGTDLGADFHPPVVDAGSDAAGAAGAAGAPDSGAGGAAGDTGGTGGDTGGTAGSMGGAGGGT